MTESEKQRIEELKKLACAATLEPWVASDEATSHFEVTSPRGVISYWVAECSHQVDAAFIAESRTAIPWLIELCERQRRQIAASPAYLAGWEAGTQKYGDYINQQEKQIAVLKEALKWIERNSGHIDTCSPNEECDDSCDVQRAAGEALAKVEEMG